LPTPLPDEKRAELLRRAEAAGIPKEQAFKDLAALEGYESAAPAAPEPGTEAFGQRAEARKAALVQQGVPVEPYQDEPRALGPPRPVTPGSETVVNIPDNPTITPELARGLLVGGAGMLAAPATTSMRLLPAMAVEGAAVGAADLGLQGLRHLIDPEYEVKPKESARAALGQAAGTGAVRTGFDILSKWAKVAPDLSRWFRDPRRFARFNRTMIEPAKGAEFELGEQIKAAVDEYSAKVIPERAQKVALLKQAEQQGVKIHGQDIVDAIESAKLETPKTKVGKDLNDALTKLQDSFTRKTRIAANPYAGQQPGMPTTGTPARVIKKVRPDLTPSEVDEFLTKELDNRIYKASGEPKDAALAEALANIRPKIKEALLSRLPAEARDLTDKIFAEMNKREVAQKAIKPELDSLETSVRNLFKQGNEGERRAIKYVGDKLGVDLEGAAFKLAQQRAFTPDQRSAATGVDALIELIRGAFARPLAKIAVPLQSGIVPTITGVRAAQREGRRIKSDQGRVRPSP
jgi:hypothetical protein